MADFFARRKPERRSCRSPTSPTASPRPSSQFPFAVWRSAPSPKPRRRASRAAAPGWPLTRPSIHPSPAAENAILDECSGVGCPPLLLAPLVRCIPSIAVEARQCAESLFPRLGRSLDQWSGPRPGQARTRSCRRPCRRRNLCRNAQSEAVARERLPDAEPPVRPTGNC
jgi:hypothetical protein